MFVDFYHSSIRKYVIVMGKLLDEITITRDDGSGTLTQSLKVPVSYGPKQKYLARLQQDPDLARQYAIALPRIGFELVDLQYDGQRKLPTINRNVAYDSTNPGRLLTQYMPVPYNLLFHVTVYSKNAEDAARIIEQILPFFTPEWNVSVNLIPEMQIKQDIAVILNSVVVDDDYQGDFRESRRVLMYNLTFTMQGYLFGPIKRAGLIKRSIVNLFTTPAVRTADVIYTNINGKFIDGELVYQSNGSQNTATGVVHYATNSELKIINTTGTFVQSNTIVGANSGAYATIASVSANTTGTGEKITVQPALLPNGSPTSNSSLSVPLAQIEADDDYGFSVTIEDI